MAKPSVYIETTIISYLCAWPSRDVIRLAQQQLTAQWWGDRRTDFDLFTSQFVVDEATAGDPAAAAPRLANLAGIPLLAITSDVVPLASRLLADGVLPAKARIDALHLAVAAANGVQYLMTWNCKHLANATMWGRMEQTCLAVGLVAPTICTPNELMGINP
jgi:hypothetical protein